MKPVALRPGLNLGDAQHLRRMWCDTPRPHSIITSPPYLDMHDYGNTSLIGTRGQDVNDYLHQMTDLFQACFDISTNDATLWLVVGSVRRNGRLIALPDKLVTRAERAGWILRESVTWDKQKALPWTHHGELRDVTEQVLLLSKTHDFRFEAQVLRSPIPNSVWWRRYPERYSPDGRLETNLWSIPIPTQGSWTGVRSHLCPFPEELTYRMLSLTTVAGDTVLDPLAGVGSVPAMAEAMGRVGYGLELTAEYTQRYDVSRRRACDFLASLNSDERMHEIFHQTILELRLLKYAKVLGQRLNQSTAEVSWVRVRKSRRKPTRQFQIIAADFDVVINDSDLGETAHAAAYELIEQRPLSKFGVDARISVSLEGDSSMRGYWYTSGFFWQSPSTQRPIGGEPHVVANFSPKPDLIDDTPYS